MSGGDKPHPDKKHFPGENASQRCPTGATKNVGQVLPPPSSSSLKPHPSSLIDSWFLLLRGLLNYRVGLVSPDMPLVESLLLNRPTSIL